jgi:thiopurine S-methyltransferase
MGDIRNTVDLAFWQARWKEGRIGFHEGRPNTYLERHLERLAGRPRVLVPMCGKSEDLALLAAHGHEVIGVELIDDAVAAFFREHELEPSITPRGPMVAYEAGPITLLVGDVFAVTRELIGPIDAIYDRAALIALPDHLRRRYVDHLRALAPKGARVLVVTLEHDAPDGPPFSVVEAELRALYDDTTIELLSEGPDPRPRPDGGTGIERCFAITLWRPVA